MADESSSLFPIRTTRITSANLPLGAQLYDNAGTPVLAADFGSRQFKAVNGITVIDFNGGPAIYDNSGFLTADLGAERYLYASDGTTIALNWAEPTQLTVGASCVVYANGNIDANSINAQLWDGTNVSVYAASRQLIANDGSTVALDWSDPTIIKLFDDNFEITADGLAAGIFVSGLGNSGLSQRFAFRTAWQPLDSNDKISSFDGATYLDNSGFHGIGSVIAGTKTATGTATTTFTVTIGVTMASTTYKAVVDGNNALSAAVHYTTNKTTTTFDVVYLAALTGAVSFDWIVTP